MTLERRLELNLEASELTSIIMRSTSMTFLATVHEAHLTSEPEDWNQDDADEETLELMKDLDAGIVEAAECRLSELGYIVEGGVG